MGAEEKAARRGSGRGAQPSWGHSQEACKPGPAHSMLPAGGSLVATTPLGSGGRWGKGVRLTSLVSGQRGAPPPVPRLGTEKRGWTVCQAWTNVSLYLV